MSIVLLGDVHIGARSANMTMANHQIRFFEECLFPYMLENGIDTIIQSGDAFDTRKFTNHVVLQEWHDRVFQIMRMYGFKMTILLGNHDTATKNSLKVNSPSLFLAQYDNITIIDEPTVFEKDGFDMLLVPWMCAENEKVCLEAINTSKTNWCMGHFEISSFDMHRGHTCTDGMSKDIFKRYERVICGHFHTQSDDGQIKYIGTPYPLTWTDYGESKGFWVLDTTTRDLKFVKNKNETFVKIVYNDSDVENTKGYHKTFDLTDVEGTYCKVVVTGKTDLYEFDRLLDKLYQINFAELKIVEDMSEFNADEIDDEEITIADTKELIETYIDLADTELDKDKLKTMMTTLFLEAQEVVE